MTTYRQIHGRSIQAVTTDPTESVAEGQVWYNTTSDTFKSVVAAEAWSSAAPLNTARYLANGFGSQTAGVYSAGQTPPGTNVANTEEYNGTGWTTATSFPSTATSGGSGGTATAGVVMGGGAPYRSTSFKYDGSSWTATGALPTAADNISACGTGTQTNIIAAIGRTPSSGNSGTNTSVTYNGSTFSSGPNLNTARMYGGAAGTGTGTAGLIFGGFIDPSPNAMTNTEEYDGSSWTNAGALNVASSFPSGFGTQTLTVAQVIAPNYGGSEQYNGSTWSALPNTGLTSPGGLYGNAAGTTGNAGWLFGYPAGAGVEFNSSANVVTAAAWSSGGLMGTGRYRMSGQNIGTKDAGMAIGGRGSFPSTAPAVTVSSVEEYNGSSWSEVNNMPTSLDLTGSFGVQTAAVQFAGYGGPGAGPNPAPGGNRISPAATNEYDGTNWTSSGAYPTSMNGLSAAGTQTAGLGFAGSSPGGVSNVTAEYDGSSWTASNNLGTARDVLGGAGIQTAALAIGGPPSPEARVEEYDGTNWTTGTALPTGSNQNGTGGTQTNALLFGGNVSPNTLVLGYDGTSWSTRPGISTARYGGSNGNSTTSGAYFAGGGGGPPTRQLTEEFTGETTTINVKTLTQS